ncbi:EamA family transporter [Microbacteriaceae bacterium 4G12]
MKEGSTQVNKAYIFVFTSILLGAFGQVFMKLGTTKMGEIDTSSIIAKVFHILFNPIIFTGLSFYAISAILWIFGISKVPLSQAYPMVAFSYVIVFVLSVLLFKEVVNLPKVGGLSLIIVGVLIIARS